MHSLRGESPHLGPPSQGAVMGTDLVHFRIIRGAKKRKTASWEVSP